MQGISLFWGRNCDTIASIEFIQLELLAARPWNEQGIFTRYQGIYSLIRSQERWV